MMKEDMLGRWPSLPRSDVTYTMVVVMALSVFIPLSHSPSCLGEEGLNLLGIYSTILEKPHQSESCAVEKSADSSLGLLQMDWRFLPI